VSAFESTSASQLVRSDVVEDYNKAVELWHGCTHPSFADLRAMLTKVGGSV